MTNQKPEYIFPLHTILEFTLRSMANIAMN